MGNLEAKIDKNVVHLDAKMDKIIKMMNNKGYI